jgi:glycosyltransferase involved in cell wall biosynthesis
MMTIHLVYVKGNSISTPAAITNELVKRLSFRYDVKIYDWAEKVVIKPEPGDILIGHPHPSSNSIFRNSFFQQGWKKRILMNPFAHAYPRYIAYFDDLVLACDDYLAICGRYWNDTISNSIVSHWQPWVTHLDLAVNLQNFPQVKQAFNAPGQRRFLYIGRTTDFKGCDYLSALADANPNITVGWIGSGKISSKRIVAHGSKNFSDEDSLKLVAEYDFLLTCGRSDANPTTILEASAWGLIPVCTPQSGYYQEDWIINIPLDNIEEASKVLRRLNLETDSVLLEYQDRARLVLENHYNWDRFAQQVIDCIESPEREHKFSNGSARRVLFVNRTALKLLAIKSESMAFRDKIYSGFKSRTKGVLKALSNKFAMY